MKIDDLVSLIESELDADFEAGRITEYRTKVKLVFDKVHLWIGRLTSREKVPPHSIGGEHPSK